jgi:hypothetical protein
MDLKSLKVFLVFLVFTIMGCASYQPPAELIMAEKAFSEARTSQAGKYAPVEFYEAEKSLGKAKESLKSKENMSKVKLYAYQAQRKAEVAKATADTRIAEEKIKETTKKRRKTVLNNKDAELKATQEKLAELREDAALMKGALLNAAGKVIVSPSSNNERMALLEDELAKKRIAEKIARLENQLRPSARPEKERQIIALQQKILELEAKVGGLKINSAGEARLSATGANARAEKLVVSGTVKDSEGSPCSGASVTLKGTYAGKTITDSNGFYSFSTDESAPQGLIYITAECGEKRGSIKIFSTDHSIKGDIIVN